MPRLGRQLTRPPKTGRQWEIHVRDEMSPFFYRIPDMLPETERLALKEWQRDFSWHMDRATAGWSRWSEPFWEIQTGTSRGHFWLLAFTNSLPYLYVDLGTGPHPIEPYKKALLAFREKYNPKTRSYGLGRIWRGGKEEGAWIYAARVYHPGIAPRAITDEIMNKLERAWDREIWPWAFNQVVGMHYDSPEAREFLW